MDDRLTPIEHDLDFTPIHDAMRRYVDGEFLPFVSTIVMRGTDVLDHFRYGHQDADGDVPLADDAIYRIFSNTKLITSVALMMLEEEGRVELDDPVATYLPAFADPVVLRPDATEFDDVEPADGPILLRHLLSHSAGLSYGFIEPLSTVDRAYNEQAGHVLNDPTVPLSEFCDVIAGLPLAFHPGARFRYSYATDVIGRVIEVVSGQRFGEFLAERIFEPLEMIDTGFHVPADKQDRLTALWAPADMLDPSKPGLQAMGDRRETPPENESGGGGLVSTMGDYLTFLRMLVSGGAWNGIRILESATLDRMRRNQLARGEGVTFPFWPMPDTTFGIGFALKDAPAEGEPDGATGEYHWGGIAGTHSWMSPRTGLTGWSGTQVFPAFWHPHAHEFKRLTYAIAG